MYPYKRTQTHTHTHIHAHIHAHKILLSSPTYTSYSTNTIKRMNKDKP
jgi:hypothetical protein